MSLRRIVTLILDVLFPVAIVIFSGTAGNAAIFDEQDEYGNTVTYVTIDREPTACERRCESCGDTGKDQFWAVKCISFCDLTQYKIDAWKQLTTKPLVERGACCLFKCQDLGYRYGACIERCDR